MLADRPYRRGRPVDEALAELRRCSGTQFDPEVVAALTAHLDAQDGVADEAAEVAESAVQRVGAARHTALGNLSSPARIGSSSRFSGGASGHAQREL